MLKRNRLLALSERVRCVDGRRDRARDSDGPPEVLLGSSAPARAGSCSVLAFFERLPDEDAVRRVWVPGPQLVPLARLEKADEVFSKAIEARERRLWRLEAMELYLTLPLLLAAGWGGAFSSEGREEEAAVGR